MLSVLVGVLLGPVACGATTQVLVCVQGLDGDGNKVLTCSQQNVSVSDGGSDH